ncbi:PLASTID TRANSCRIPTIONALLY ACTIVE protein 6, chloroplastic isoform X2 [Cryptomeria japonica]|uniref:PLASTID TRANSCRIPTIONALLY ACTIVE protein 6, chloroplastic isoform X2 n=1 Tax=Cryptomeria japonica TaxID=3369 RepID=UPI0025AD3457|nr:PLASTID TRANSCRIPTIONALLY ACTIVE protein 6, chloroplastic isoform X2 [Cryptomeria japonica]
MAAYACTSRPIHLILFDAPVLSPPFHVQSKVICCQLKSSHKLVCKSNRANTSIRLRPSILEKQQQHSSSNGLFENGRWRIRSGDEDFNAGEGEGENEDGLGKDEGEEEDTLDWNDYETDYTNDTSGNDFNTHESGTLVNTQGWKSEMLVPHTINQNEFHKIHLLDCDFFIRKVPDPDDDVFDFREMYVSPPDIDVYSIPEVVGKMPNKYIRLRKSDYGCYNVIELPVSRVRDPFAKTEFEVMKVFLMKHYENRRADDPNFVLDFEEIYVIDSKTKSISRANVLLSMALGIKKEEFFNLMNKGYIKLKDEDVMCVEWWLKFKDEEENDDVQNYSLLH